MKKGLKIFCCLAMLGFLALASGCDGRQQDKAARQTALNDNEIYFFYYDECPYCHKAMDYLKEHHKTLKISKQDIKTKQGMNLFEKCAQKFQLGNRVGTPLFCIGDTYVLGWSPENAALLDETVETFLKKNAPEK